MRRFLQVLRSMPVCARGEVLILVCVCACTHCTGTRSCTGASARARLVQGVAFCRPTRINARTRTGIRIVSPRVCSTGKHVSSSLHDRTRARIGLLEGVHISMRDMVPHFGLQSVPCAISCVKKAHCGPIWRLARPSFSGWRFRIYSPDSSLTPS